MFSSIVIFWFWKLWYCEKPCALHFTVKIEILHSKSDFESSLMACERLAALNSVIPSKLMKRGWKYPLKHQEVGQGTPLKDSKLGALINEWVLSVVLKVLFGIHQSFVLLLCFSLWIKHGGHTSGFSCWVLSVTFWSAEAAWVIGNLEPSTYARTQRFLPGLLLLVLIMESRADVSPSSCFNNLFIYLFIIYFHYIEEGLVQAI